MEKRIVVSLSALLSVMIMMPIALGAASIGTSANTLAVSQKPGKGFSTSFIISNNGTDNLTSIANALVTTDLSGFNITVAPSSFNLNVNGTQPVTVTGTVPKDINTRLSPFRGTITISNAQVSKSVSLEVKADKQLTLDNIKADVDSKSKSIDSGDTIRDAKPGSKIVIRGDARNLFTDNEDVTIESVTVTVTLKDVDDGDDLEEEDDVGDVEADEEETFRVEFEIPEDVEQDDYDVVFNVEGEDENGAKHDFVLEGITLKVEKDRHDILIEKASISPSRISCSRGINVNVDLKNQGREDENEVVVRLENGNVGISQEDTSIPEIEEGTGTDTELSKNYAFRISDDVSPGTYPITVRVFYETDVLSDLKNVDLIVEECKQAAPPKVEDQESQETSDDTSVVITPPPAGDTGDEGLEVIEEPISETSEGIFSIPTPYLIGIGAVLAVSIIVVIILVIVVYTMKKREQ
ncbi:hypothetical protein HYU13_00685 [Candidatus Woesearchaeota archaeon]|nr:hypothetical protein [Candidatus Woesearchaeota archaeon]